MRFILALFVSFCFFQTSTAMSAYTLKLLIWAAEYGLKNLGTIDLLKNPNETNFNNVIAKGSLGCNKLSLYGLESLEVDLDKIQVTIEKDGDARTVIVNLNITVPKTVGINVTKYKADLALPNDFPLYGEGNASASTINLDAHVHVSLLLNGSNTVTLNELTLNPTLGFVGISLTGFFNNPDPTLNFAISSALTAIGNVVAAFWDTHINCCSCALSTLVKAVLHNQLDVFRIWNSLQADCKTLCTTSHNEIVETLFMTENPLELASYWTSPAGLAKAQQYLDKFMKY